MIRKALRNWLFPEPPNPCGQHTIDLDGPPRQEVMDQPDMNGPGLLFDEKRIATTGEWLITVWDKPGGILLGAFIDSYQAAFDAAKAYGAMIMEEQAMRKRSADPYAPRNG